MMPATPNDLKRWHEVDGLVHAMRRLAERSRPNLAAADVEVDVLLTWLDSCDESVARIVALIDADLLEQDQIESGDVVRDAAGNVVATSYTRYP